MGPLGVVALDPFGNHGAGVIKAVEQGLVQVEGGVRPSLILEFNPPPGSFTRLPSAAPCMQA